MQGQKGNSSSQRPIYMYTIVNWSLIKDKTRNQFASSLFASWVLGQL